VRIGPAAAQIAGHVLADTFVGARVTFRDTCNRRHDLTWGAISALEGIVTNEGFLHRVQFAVGQSFDGGDCTPFDLGGKRQTRQDPPSINVNGASAALTLVAALLGAMEVRIFPQSIEQRHPTLNLQQMLRPIDYQPDLGGAFCCVRHDLSLAMAVARGVNTSPSAMPLGPGKGSLGGD
jgi:hypothetical protein